MNFSTLQDSDSSDDDYVPNENSEENLSGDDSGDKSESDNLCNKDGDLKTRKRAKSTSCLKKQKKVKHDDYTSDNPEPKPLTVENQKKIEEDVWADFMRDTGFQPRGKRSGGGDNSKTSSPQLMDGEASDSKKKLLVTEVVNFAGEDITIKKKLSQSMLEEKLLKEKNLRNNSKTTQRGVGGILSQLTKKPKINTLEKSKLDWDQFKQEEQLEEELQTHNKGKDGYLEKQDFLRRADLRRFEIEKEIRTIERKKRDN